MVNNKSVFGIYLSRTSVESAVEALKSGLLWLRCVRAASGGREIGRGGD
jgi:hypothetical protein